jgi:hypothetical protein
VDPVALNALRNNPDYFRAGSVGPVGYPDMFTGQMKIHTNTQQWLIHIWNSAKKYSAGEVNTSPLLAPDNKTTSALGPRDANQAWSFVYGYLTHCGGDMWAHDWVNYYAGGVFPGLNEVKANPQASLTNVARHLSIEGTLDKKVSVSSKNVAIPKDFVFRYMVVDPQAKVCGMNPAIEYFHNLYWQKSAHRGRNTYDGCWFYDLELGLVKWVCYNETALEQAVEWNNPKNLIMSEVDNLGEWASIHALDMLGFPSIVRYVGEAGVGAGDAFWSLLGLSDEERNDLRSSFVDACLQTTMGVTQDDLKARFESEVNSTVFPNAAVLAEINQEIGNIPPESGWVHDNTDHARFRQFVQNINGPLYNSVITGKMAILSQAEARRLDSWAASAKSLNLLIGGNLRSIDYSRQWKDFLNTGYAADDWDPRGYGAFHYVFKPCRPVDTGSSTIWCQKYTNQPTEVSWANVYAGKVEGTISAAQGVDMSTMKVLVRKAGETEPWSIVDISGTSYALALLQPNVQNKTPYIIRPMHSRLNFDSVQVTVNPPVDLFQTVNFNSLGSVPANVQVVSDGQTDARLGVSAAVAKTVKNVKLEKARIVNLGDESGKGINCAAFVDRFKNAPWRKIDTTKLSQELTMEVPVFDGQGRPTGQTTTINVGGSGSSQAGSGDRISFHATPRIEHEICGVQGNSIGLASETTVAMDNCILNKNSRALPIFGCPGKLVISSGDDCITPSRPVELSFVVDDWYCARFGVNSLSQLIANPNAGGRSVVLKVGSHPGIIKMKVTLNLSPAIVAPARMMYAFKQVNYQLTQVHPNAGRATEWAGVKQMVSQPYQYASNPASGEQALLTAINAVNDTTYSKHDILNAYNMAISDFPGADAGIWTPRIIDAAMLMVQPNATGADSDSVPPSFTVVPVASTNSGTDTNSGSNTNTNTNPAGVRPDVPRATDVRNKVKTPAAGR